MAGRILAVGNLKGGTGKTTVAVNLGCSLASPRREVVLIDADSQGTATAWGDFLKILKLVDAPPLASPCHKKNAPSPDSAPRARGGCLSD